MSEKLDCTIVGMAKEPLPKELEGFMEASDRVLSMSIPDPPKGKKCKRPARYWSPDTGGFLCEICWDRIHARCPDCNRCGSFIRGMDSDRQWRGANAKCEVTKAFWKKRGKRDCGYCAAAKKHGVSVDEWFAQLSRITLGAQ